MEGGGEGVGVGGVGLLECRVLAGEEVGECFGGLTTAATGGCRPESASVHMVTEGEAFVVNGRNTNAGTEGLGGKSIVDGFPVEGVKDRRFVAGEFVQACPGVDGGASGNVAQDVGSQGRS